MRSWAVASLVIAAGAGCQLERFFPDDVGVGVARLTVRNSALLLSAVTDDAVCGFASEGVKAATVVEGELGGYGKVTQTVTACEIDMGELHQVKTDCSGIGTSMGGRAVVTAVRTIEGTITGNPANPVIPTHSEAVVVQVQADLDGWTAFMSNRTTQLTQVSGGISFTVKPHLAVRTDDLNAVATQNITLEDISYADAKVIVDPGDREPFPVDVPASSYRAQIGQWLDRENTFDGVMSVWDDDVEIPHEGDDVLDPDYVREEFIAGWSCNPDLKQPIEYVAPPLTPKLVQAGSRLAVKMTGAIVSALKADTRCGFESPAVLAAPILTGTVGQDGGAAKYVVENCRLVFPEKTEISRDCLGDVTSLQGGVVVSGSLTVRGILTGDPAQPVVPTSRDPAEIDVDAALEGIKVSSTNSTTEMQALSGKLSARMRPRMAKDAITGACSISTPVVQFSGVHLENAAVLVIANGSAFRLAIDSTDLQAQNGERDGVENALTGTAVVDGEVTSLPIPGEQPILNPDYDPTEFAAQYACTPQMVPVSSDEDCRFTDVLAEGAARLVIQSAGVLASLVNKNDSCGFEDMLGVLVNPTEVVGDVGETGSMTWEVEDCSVGSSGLAVASESCDGDVTYVQGEAIVDARRTVTGEREKKFFLVDSIIPRSRDAVTVYLDSVELADFVAFTDPAGPDGPLGKLTIHQGTLSAVVRPATGERADDPGVFDVPTPVAKLTEVRLENATATLESAGKLFTLQIPSATLAAVNGPYHDEANLVGGEITVNGDVVDVPAGALDVSYTQSSFDASYACTENLAGPVPVGW
jgi:hypothetical protein